MILLALSFGAAVALVSIAFALAAARPMRNA
jgi:hypothetical protein